MKKIIILPILLCLFNFTIAQENDSQKEGSKIDSEKEMSTPEAISIQVEAEKELITHEVNRKMKSRKIFSCQRLSKGKLHTQNISKAPKKKLKNKKRTLLLGGVFLGVIGAILMALLISALTIAFFFGLIVLYLWFFPAW